MFKLKIKFLNLVTKITSVQMIFLLFHGPQINFVIFLNISRISFQKMKSTHTNQSQTCVYMLHGVIDYLNICFVAPPHTHTRVFYIRLLLICCPL